MILTSLEPALRERMQQRWGEFYAALKSPFFYRHAADPTPAPPAPVKTVHSHVHTHVQSAWTCLRAGRGTARMDVCRDMCIDICTGMCLDMCTGMCMDMCTGMCVDV